jgi:hypothetical protein
MVGVVLDQLSLHAVNDRLSHLRAAGIIEEDRRTPQGGEFRADHWKIEGHSYSLNSG